MTPAADRRYCRMTLWLTLAGIAAVMLGNYLVDPLQHYRIPTWYRPVFIANARYAIPGIVRHYEFDTVVIGSSHARFYLPEYLAESLGGQAVGLSLTGSHLPEQAEVARLALASGKVRRLLWVASLGSAIGPGHSAWETLPRYLYEPDWTTHVKLLANLDTLRYGLDIARGRGEHELSLYQTWYLKILRFGEQQPKQLRSLYAIPRYPANCRAHLWAYLRPFLSQYPEVEFIVILPPHAMYYFAGLYEIKPRTWQALLDYRLALAELAAEFPQMRLYDFQTRDDLTSDYAHYSDPTHPHPQICRQVLRDLSAGHQRVTPEMMPAANALLAAQLQAFLARPEAAGIRATSGGLAPVPE